MPLLCKATVYLSGIVFLNITNRFWIQRFRVQGLIHISAKLFFAPDGLWKVY